MTNETVFFEIHKDIPREGPGDNQSTQRAFGMLKNLPTSPRILDIGCGPGMQTLELTRLSKGNITALDYKKDYLEELRINAEKAGVENIELMEGSMFQLPFSENSFDVIWAEGAIYIIGFEKGIKEWKPFIKEGGYLAVTHVSWLKPNPPEELKKFWKENYPDITSIENNISIIETSGYSSLGHFSLPESAWWDDYYRPIEIKVKALREKYKQDPEALSVLDVESTEIDLYRRYSEYYGYVFYIMQKI